MSKFLLVAPILHVCHLRRKSKALHCGIFRRRKKDIVVATILVLFGSDMWIFDLHYRFDTKFTQEVTIEHRGSDWISISASDGIHFVSRISTPHSCACKHLLHCLEQKEPSNRQESKALPILVTLVIFLWFYDMMYLLFYTMYIYHNPWWHIWCLGEKPLPTTTCKAVLKWQTPVLQGVVFDNKTPGCHCVRP